MESSSTIFGLLISIPVLLIFYCIPGGLTKYLSEDNAGLGTYRTLCRYSASVPTYGACHGFAWGQARHVRNSFTTPRLTRYSSGTISFGGTNSQHHYNDIWTYNTTSRTWAELHCIGFIPPPREGHSAALVDDIVYVYGGRGVDGKDVGDLGGFRISGAYPMQRRYSLQFIRKSDELIIHLTKSSAAVRFRSKMVYVPEYGTGA